MNEICRSLSALQTIHKLNNRYCHALQKGSPYFPLVSTKTLRVTARALEIVGLSALTGASLCAIKRLKDIVITVAVTASLVSGISNKPKLVWQKITKASEFVLAAIAIRVTTVALTLFAHIQALIFVARDMWAISTKVRANPQWKGTTLCRVEFLFIKHLVLSFATAYGSMVIPEFLFWDRIVNCKTHCNNRAEELILQTAPENLDAFDHFISTRISLPKLAKLFDKICALPITPIWFKTDRKVLFLNRLLFADNVKKEHIEPLLNRMDNATLYAFCRNTNITFATYLNQLGIAPRIINRFTTAYTELENESPAINEIDFARVITRKLTKQQHDQLLAHVRAFPTNATVQNYLKRYATLEQQWKTIEPTSKAPLQTAWYIEKLARITDKTDLENIDKRLGGRRLIVNWDQKAVVIVSKKVRDVQYDQDAFTVLRPALYMPLDLSKLDQTKKVTFVKSTFQVRNALSQLLSQYSKQDSLQKQRPNSSGLLSLFSATHTESNGIVPIDFFGIVDNQLRKQFVCVQKFFDSSFETVIATYRDTINANAAKIIKLLSCVLNGLSTVHANNRVFGTLTPQDILVSGDTAALTHFAGTITEQEFSRAQIAKTIFRDPLLSRAYRRENFYNNDHSKVDIFAFGMILYQLISTETPPWAHNDKNQSPLQALQEFRSKIEKTLHISSSTPYSPANERLFSNFIHYIVYLCTNPNVSERPTANKLRTLLNQFRLA